MLRSPGVGGLLREWRHRRRLSQLDLAVHAEVSARHISFVETGRSVPSRELVIHLSERLDVPLRDRNSMLLAAGYAPLYRQTALEADEMVPVRDALDRIVIGHQPYPAVVVDRHWDLVVANDGARAILTPGVDPELLDPPINVLRATLHPRGMAPRIANLAEWAEHLIERLERQIAVTGAKDLIELAAELRSYPGIASPARPTDVASRLFVPLVLECDGAQLSLVSTIATFGTALDVTIAELAIESFFPIDAATRTYLATDR